MPEVSFISLVLLIIFVIVVIILLISLNYNSTTSSKGKNITKNLTKIKVENEKPVTINTIQPVTEYNTYTFEIPKSHKQIAYIVNGKFSNSSLTVYTENKRVYSKTFNGDVNLVLAANLYITVPVFKLNKNKSYLVPLSLNKSHKIVVNNVSNINIQTYNVNYEIDTREIVYDDKVVIGTTEYDIETYIREKLTNIEERVYFKNSSMENISNFNGTGNYAIVYIDNISNYDLQINSETINVRKDTKPPTIEIRYIDNPKLEVKNLDFHRPTKNVNHEYIDFITSPNYLMNKFLNGSESKNVHFENRVNDKVLIYKLKSLI